MERKRHRGNICISPLLSSLHNAHSPTLPPQHHPFQSLPHLVQSDFNHHFRQNTLSQCVRSWGGGRGGYGGGWKNTEWRIRFAIVMHHSGITLEIKEGMLHFNGVVLMVAWWMTVLLQLNEQETLLSTKRNGVALTQDFIPIRSVNLFSSHSLSLIIIKKNKKKCFQIHP